MSLRMRQVRALEAVLGRPRRPLLVRLLFPSGFGFRGSLLFGTRAHQRVVQPVVSLVARVLEERPLRSKEGARHAA